MIGIRVVSRSGVPLDRLSLGAPLMARFGDAVGDIGRGADCTLVLPDPERTISRRQALITCRSGQYYICPIGAHAAIELDGRPLNPDVETEIEIGSEIRIGPYVLRVEDAPDERAPAAPAAVAPPPAAARAVDDPLALLGREKAPAASVFSDLLDGESIAPGASAVPPKTKPAVVAAASVQPAQSPAAGKEGANQAEALSRLERAAPHGKAQSVAVAADDPSAALSAALGLPMPQDPEQRSRQAKLVAELLREAVRGLLELLATRSIAKREIGADATQLVARENNPLKFSPDADTALAHLLGPPQRGFSKPLDAMRSAFGDLRAHELAMLTGMRAALDEVLARFDPSALASRLAPDALWEALVPAKRKARLWELYGQQYAEILREIEGDFDTLFNRAFLRAYQAQLAELKRAETTGGS